MGTDTGLYLSNRWDIEDVMAVIENHLGVKPELRQTGMPSYNLLVFEYQGEKRQLNVHYSCNTPLGKFTQINLGKWGKCDEIITTIGEVLGGLYFDNDSDGKFEFIDGKLNEDSNLSFHVKNAIIENKAETLLDVAMSIRKWNAHMVESGNIVGQTDHSNELIGNSKFGRDL
jgi:hypothetical protein